MYAGVPSTDPARDSSASEPLRRVRIASVLVPDVPRPLLVGDAPLVEDLGQAPVHHLDLAEAADHHVRRLQVAVDHPPGVGVGHRLADLLEDREEPRPVVRRVLPRLQQRGQGAAPDQLHGDVEPPVGEPAQLVDRDDPRVLELAADLRLLDEPADHLGVVAVLLQEDLDGQVAAEVDVAALEHDAHAAPGDLAEELVAPALARRGRASPRSAGGPAWGPSPGPSRSRTRGTGPIDSWSQQDAGGPASIVVMRVAEAWERHGGGRPSREVGPRARPG